MSDLFDAFDRMYDSLRFDKLPPESIECHQGHIDDLVRRVALEEGIVFDAPAGTGKCLDLEAVLKEYANRD